MASIVEWFLWTIEHTNSSLDNSKHCFAHHGLRQFVCMPDEAHDGRNVALNYQVNCWCARPSKGIFYYQLSMPNNFHNNGKHLLCRIVFVCSGTDQEFSTVFSKILLSFSRLATFP